MSFRLHCDSARASQFFLYTLSRKPPKKTDQNKILALLCDRVNNCNQLNGLLSAGCQSNERRELLRVMEQQAKTLFKSQPFQSIKMNWIVIARNYDTITTHSSNAQAHMCVCVPLCECMRIAHMQERAHLMINWQRNFDLTVWCANASRQISAKYKVRFRTNRELWAANTVKNRSNKRTTTANKCEKKTNTENDMEPSGKWKKKINNNNRIKMQKKLSDWKTRQTNKLDLSDRERIKCSTTVNKI